MDMKKVPPGITCGVCQKQESKYTCVRCGLPFCSVACSTLHRATHPALGDETQTQPSNIEPAHAMNGAAIKPERSPAPASLPRSPFYALETSTELKTLFLKYPQLQSQLRAISDATLPPIEESIYSSASYNGATGGRGLPGNGSGRGPIPWNTDRGTQDGLDALKIQCQLYGMAGDGIREYHELVLRLVGSDGADVAKMVEREVAEENATIISQLLNGSAGDVY